MKKKTIIYAVIIAIASALIASVVTYEITKQKEEVVEIQEPVKEIEYVILPEETKITGEEIQAGINDLSELNTADYYFTRVESSSDQRTCDWFEIFGIEEFNVPLTSNLYVYSYDGEIKAGIDFNKVKVEKDDETKIVSIKCPKAKITNSLIDPDSFKCYEKKNNILNPLDPGTMSEGIKDMLKAEEDKAVAGGLLTRAQDNAKIILEDFVRNMCESKDYKIEINFVA